MTEYDRHTRRNDGNARTLPTRLFASTLACATALSLVAPASGLADAFTILVDGAPVDETGKPKPASPGVAASARTSRLGPTATNEPEAKPVRASMSAAVDPRPTVSPSSEGRIPLPRLRPVAGAGTHAPQAPAVPVRASLDRVRIDVAYDPDKVERALGVTLEDRRRDGGGIVFHAHANYPRFIESSELRVFCEGASKPCARLPLVPNGTFEWTDAPENAVAYSYHVANRGGRNDETERRPIDAPDGGALRLPLARQDIPIEGGTVRVSGRDVPAGQPVRALGHDVTAGADGTFLLERLVPPGDHRIGATVSSHEGTLDYSRTLHVPGSHWFMVGIADLTVHRALRGKGFQRADGEFERTQTRGRLAFYLKGKVKGSVLITAAADTEENELRHLFRDLDARHARDLLRRLDPDDYYPVYGDDSTLIEDAPTNGKFYVRVERGDSHVMWGNARTRLTGTELLSRQRTLYGASGKLMTEARTSRGEARASATGFAAMPDTRQHRDALRGTGGASYFLSRQDIVRGSETLTIERRDRLGGRVLERRELRYGEDYEIDYSEGVVLLRRPLASTARGGDLVRDGALDDDQLWLVAAYEHVPRASDVDAHTYGGRAEAWLSEHVRVGATGLSERDRAAGRSDALGADVKVQHSEGTWVSAEIARTRGVGSPINTSLDGGLSFVESAPVGPAREADAVRVTAALDLADATGGLTEGTLLAFYERAQAGFARNGRASDTDETSAGASLELKLSERWALRAGIDELRRDDGTQTREIDASVTFSAPKSGRLGGVRVEVGARQTKRRDRLSQTRKDGTRTDVAARVGREFGDGHEAYVFGQATVDRHGAIERSDRLGVGGTAKLSDTLALQGEVSYGTGGAGALAGITYDPAPGAHSYLTYTLDQSAERGARNGHAWGDDFGGIALGTRRTLGEHVTVHAGNTFDMFDSAWTLAQTYGITVRPDEFWTLGGGVEAGTIRDRTLLADGTPAEDFDRRALSASLGYVNDDRGLTGRVRVEGRRERSARGTRDRDVLLASVDAAMRISDDWRLLGNLDVVSSYGIGLDHEAGDYIEGSIGYAYRPVDHDRFEALARYTYLHDLAGLPRGDGDTSTLEPVQISHIASIDGSLRVTPRLEVGGKLGARLGRSRTRGTDEPWRRNDALLAVARADVHVINRWDAFGELRWLGLRGGEERNDLLGGVLGISRHVGRNLKVGVGYNFGRFSDDLRDLTLDEEGVFLTATGKF